MRVAVTGANGFVGRHVLQELGKDERLEVVATSRATAGDWLPRHVRHVRLDVADGNQSAYHQLGCPEVLIHLAWGGLPNYRATHHFDTQLGEQYRFLRGLVEAGLPSILCTGTCFEYGMQPGELNELMTTEPETAYGFAKDALRRQLQFLRQEAPFQLTWARLFYMYGEGQSSGSLYSQFVAGANRGDEFFKMSGGEQLRDYLPVSQVAQILTRLAISAPDAGLVNVCAGYHVSIRALVESWIAEKDSKIKLMLGHYPYPVYEPMAFWGSSEKLNRLMETP